MDLLILTVTQLFSSRSFCRTHQKLAELHPERIAISPSKTLSRILQAWSHGDFGLVKEFIDIYSHSHQEYMDSEIEFSLHLLRGTYYCDTGKLHKAVQQFQLAYETFSGHENHSSIENDQQENDLKRAIIHCRVAWCQILGNQLDCAREILQADTNFSIAEVKDHHSVLLAIVDYLEGDEASAEARLLEATEAYTSRQDFAALSAIQLYQAAIHSNTDAQHPFLANLKKSLWWLQEHGYCYLPYWWHPQVMQRLLTTAIEVGCYPQQARLMLTHTHHARPVLVTQFNVSSHKERALVATNKGYFLSEESLDQNAEAKMSTKCLRAKTELTHMIEVGFLNEQKLPQLARKIPHGTNGRELNPTILAVFGLYVQHISISEIASRLSIAISTVKAYITKIYNAFELHLQNFSAITDRRELLVEKATIEGYLR